MPIDVHRPEGLDDEIGLRAGRRIQPGKPCLQLGVVETRVPSAAVLNFEGNSDRLAAAVRRRNGDLTLVHTRALFGRHPKADPERLYGAGRDRHLLLEPLAFFVDAAAIEAGQTLAPRRREPLEIDAQLIQRSATRHRYDLEGERFVS
ncbi:MAG: hypothetical protein PVJ43_06605 [Gemmatimonadales bacterium]